MAKSVLLGFSGGIDSCTSARLLQEQGYRVVALTIDTIGNAKMIRQAKSKAHDMGIEWIGYDCREQFQHDIIDHFCSEYIAGRTPAPCTRCNRLIKWRVLLDVADQHAIDHIATGHYFNIERHGNKYYVAKGADPAKDQSYYLWGLSQQVLSRALTPMGQIIKSDIKEQFSDQSESMGICFLQGSHYADFLKSCGYALPSGDMADSRGMVLGRHNGIARYTIGQRRGEGIPEQMRVIDIDAATNRVIVGDSSLLTKHELYIEECTIVDREELLTANDITIKIRGIGRNPAEPVTIEPTERGYKICCRDGAWAPAKGQPLVLYRNNLVVGGGIVCSFN